MLLSVRIIVCYYAINTAFYWVLFFLGLRGDPGPDGLPGYGPPGLPGILGAPGQIGSE